MKFSASTLALLVVCATLGHLDGANAMERGSGPQLERFEEARQLPRNDYALSKLTLNMQVRQQLASLRQSGQLDNRPVIADQYKFKSRFWSRKSSAKNCDPRRRRQWAFAKVLDYYTSAALRNSRAWPWSFRGATTTKLLAAEEKLHLLKGTLGMFFIASNKERQFPIASGTLDKRDRMFSEELVQLRLKLKSEYAALEGEVRKAHMRIMYGKMRKLPLVGAPITKVDEVQAAQSVAKLQYALERELQKLMIGVEDNNAALQVYYCGAEFEAAREEAKEKSKSRFRWPDLSGARTTAGNAVGTVKGFFGGLFGSRSNPSQVKTSPDQVD